MKQSLEQLLIAFTTEAQLQSLARVYLAIAKWDNDKKVSNILENYIKNKEVVSSQLLNFVQELKDMIGEYENNDERAIEVGGSFGVDSWYSNVQDLIKIEKYLLDVIYPECAENMANEWLPEYSENIRDLAWKSKKNLTIFQELHS